MKESKNNKNIKKVTIEQKENKKKHSKFWDDTNEIKKLIVIFLIVVAVFGVFYLLTVFIDNNRSKEVNEDTTVAVIQYDEILVGEILNQNKDAYYVLVTKTETNDVLYQSYIDRYTSLEDSLKIYQVDLNSVFNNKFLAQESNFDIDKISDIRFSDDTLLKIENGDLVEDYQGKDKILDILDDLS